MPYIGDSPVEAWQYWFDEPPSEKVRKHLENRGKTHSAATIIEAIELTSDRLLNKTTAEAQRLQYLCGILRQKVLASVDPKMAERQHQINIVQQWMNRKFGNRRWNKEAFDCWLEHCNLSRSGP